MAGVLAGLKVLDLSWGVAGPMTTMQMADHGGGEAGHAGHSLQKDAPDEHRPLVDHPDAAANGVSRAEIKRLSEMPWNHIKNELIFRIIIPNLSAMTV